MDQDLQSITKRMEALKQFNTIREKIINQDRRFSQKNGCLHFEDIDLYELGQQFPTPLYVFSEKEIVRNIKEIKEAFKRHPNTKIFYASKACSIMKVLEIVKNQGIYAEANSLYEIMKCLEIGFKGDEIVFNGVVKNNRDLEYAIENNIYSINIDSFFELSLIEEISNRLKKTANVSIRIEPNVPSPTHPSTATAYHAKAGIDLKEAEEMCKRILNMKHVKLKGLHFHVGSQVPTSEPFAKAAKIVVEEAARIENKLNFKFELINVGGGIPVPYKYGEGDALSDYFYGGINSSNFADAIIDEIHKWRNDIEICIEPGRKVVSSSAVLLTTIESEKTKTIYDENFNFLNAVNWKFIDAGYHILSESLLLNWFFYLFNTKGINEEYNKWFKIAGPLCDGGDYFHEGVEGEFYLMPNRTTVGDVLAFLDAGSYTIENQSVYTNRPRAAAVLINKEGKVELIRRSDNYSDIVNYDIY